MGGFFSSRLKISVWLTFLCRKGICLNRGGLLKGSDVKLYLYSSPSLLSVEARITPSLSRPLFSHRSLSFLLLFPLRAPLSFVSANPFDVLVRPCYFFRLFYRYYRRVHVRVFRVVGCPFSCFTLSVYAPCAGVLIVVAFFDCPGGGGGVLSPAVWGLTIHPSRDEEKMRAYVRDR